MAFQHTRFTLQICYHTHTWALTPHFHPYLPRLKRDQAVIFCGTFCTLPSSFKKKRIAPPVRWCVTLCCPDFPHILPLQAEQAIARFVVSANVIEKLTYGLMPEKYLSSAITITGMIFVRKSFHFGCILQNGMYFLL